VRARKSIAPEPLLDLCGGGGEVALSLLVALKGCGETPLSRGLLEQTFAILAAL
jgi:hypothetical protein